MNSKKFVNIWGDGNESRDFLHINDLISFVDLAIKNKEKILKYLMLDPQKYVYKKFG